MSSYELYFSKPSYICILMLREYSKITCPIEAIKIGVIVGWKGEEKGRYYVKGISIGWSAN